MKAELGRVGLWLARLSRYSSVFWALLLLVSMALSLGAGIKWESFEFSWLDFGW